MIRRKPKHDNREEGSQEQDKDEREIDFRNHASKIYSYLKEHPESILKLHGDDRKIDKYFYLCEPQKYIPFIVRGHIPDGLYNRSYIDRNKDLCVFRLSDKRSSDGSCPFGVKETDITKANQETSIKFVIDLNRDSMRMQRYKCSIELGDLNRDYPISDANRFRTFSVRKLKSSGEKSTVYDYDDDCNEGDDEEQEDNKQEEINSSSSEKSGKRERDEDPEPAPEENKERKERKQSKKLAAGENDEDDDAPDSDKKYSYEDMMIRARYFAQDILINDDAGKLREQAEQRLLETLGKDLKTKVAAQIEAMESKFKSKEAEITQKYAEHEQEKEKERERVVQKEKEDEKRYQAGIKRINDLKAENEEILKRGVECILTDNRFIGYRIKALDAAAEELQKDEQVKKMAAKMIAQKSAASQIAERELSLVVEAPVQATVSQSLLQHIFDQ